jgi:Fe-S oxidoreductase
VLDGRIDIDDELVDIVYQCQTCGACDTSCKYGLDLEILEPIYELREKCVERDQVPAAHKKVMAGLRKEGNMLQMARDVRGNWANGIDVKNINEEKAEVYYHVGCRYSHDQDLWPAARVAVTTLKKFGVDVGIAGKDEACCGGRAYELGYRDEFSKFAPTFLEKIRASGIQAIVTSCADCYHTFKVLFDKIGSTIDMPVYHITEYLDDLIKQGRMKPEKDVKTIVTYHDPCHLGRLGEPWKSWNGKIKTDLNSRIIHEPKKPWRKGTDGVYDAPRNVLKSIPGLKLVEMERTREYSWCCGAGGGVIDAYPEYGQWTALERIKEAKDSGAECIVTSCPWCIRTFKDGIQESGMDLHVYDVVEIVEQSI